MGYLTFRGDKNRSADIINTLEMFGEKNIQNIVADNENSFYYGAVDNIIKEETFEIDVLDVYSIEEFEEKYPFKVNDKVKFNKQHVGVVEHVYWSYFLKTAVYFVVDENGKHFRELTVDDLKFYDQEDEENADTTNNINHNENNKEDTNTPLVGCIITRNGDYEVVCHKEYDIVMEDGKIFLRKKKTVYPKTFEECCKVLNINPSYQPIPEEIPHFEEIETMRKLFICRDAFWKLSDNWSPDWSDNLTDKYCINCTNGKLNKEILEYHARFLAFPSLDVRDLFFEYFNEMIEKVKFVI